MSAKTVLVLGANAGQADLIRHMKMRGWTVHACALDASFQALEHVDHFEEMDLADLDLVIALARRIDADLIYSISSDITMKIAVKASDILGLPHFYSNELIELFDQKHLLRAHLNKAGLSKVAYAQVQDAGENLDWAEFPCVVKPADAQGQRGVQIVSTSADLKGALSEAVELSPKGTAVIEQYLTGVEISANVLVENGKIIINELSERLVHQGELYGIPKGHIVPCYNVSDEMAEAAQQLVRNVVASLNINRGCLYFQMKITPDGPKIIEIAPRLDGCHVWRAIDKARGIDFLAATVDVLLGNPVKLQPHDMDAPIYELMFQQTPPNIAFGKEKFPAPGDAQHHEYRYLEGQTVLPVNGQMEVVGYYVRPVGAEEVVKFEDEKQ